MSKHRDGNIFDWGWNKIQSILKNGFDDTEPPQVEYDEKKHGPTKKSYHYGKVRGGLTRYTRRY
ncbi:MAG: hypothetical protein ACRCXZ_10235 [Patescibacteria group bacterium]